jgi:hypothetical protein
MSGQPEISPAQQQQPVYDDDKMGEKYDEKDIEVLPVGPDGVNHLGNVEQAHIKG